MSGSVNPPQQAFPVGEQAFGPQFVQAQQARANARFGRQADAAGTMQMLVNMQAGKAAQQAELAP